MQLDNLQVKEEKAYEKSQKKYLLLILIVAIGLLAIFLTSLCVGNYRTNVKDVFLAIVSRQEYPQVYTIVVYSRLPRLVASMFVGASLAISGFCYQNIFKNKMASPDLLGVSAGASVGAVVAILLNFSFAIISLFSFFGGIFAVLATVLVAKLFKEDNFSVSLLLSGIVISGLMNALVGIAKFVSNDAQLSSITYWLLGGFNNVKYEQLAIVCPIMLVCIVLLLMLRWKIVMLQNADFDAISHGIDVKKIRIFIVVLATLVTALSVSISGTVGWVGLAIPNLINLFVNNDSKKAIVLSVLFGSLFTMCCDLLARSLTASEIPVGIITGAFGAIIFIVILIIKRVQKCTTRY